MRQRGDIAVRLLLAVVFLLAAIGFVAIRINGDAGRVVGGSTRSDPAPEFAGIEAWINSEPLTLAGLRGKVVLVDFWTFSCINCLRTIPSLQALNERYGPAGLQIVGVHSPEFAFEKPQKAVRDAVKKLGVTWPVGLDNDMATWRAYSNRYWPHVYLIDAKGVIRYDKVGEGDEDEVETRIRALLADAGRPLPEPIGFAEPVFSAQTPEIYAGYLRGEDARTIANPEGYRRERVVRYSAPDAKTLQNAATDGKIYLEGGWIARQERLEATTAGRIFLPFFARDVHIVALSSPPSGVGATLDGKRLRTSAASQWAVSVDTPQLYTLVRLPTADRHLLVLDVQPGFAFYTFTFG